jgi:SAM-dependent methyltransferase
MGTILTTAVTRERQYWDQYLAEDSLLDDQSEWLGYSRELYASWVRNYLRGGDRCLKTDAFEEIRGSEVASALAERFQRIVIADIAYSPLRFGARRAETPAKWVQTPVQSLPFADGSFDAVASFSTLDHFQTHEEIGASLHELARLTRRGGQLLITLDNAANPVVALRNLLPHKLLASTGIAPYEYGKTLTPSAFRAALTRAGWNITKMHGAVHVPRALAVAASAHCSAQHRNQLRACLRPFEALSKVPTNLLTGYFTLAVCERL